MSDYRTCNGRMCKEDFVAFMGKLKDKKNRLDAAAKKLSDVFGSSVGYDFMEDNGAWWMFDYVIDMLVYMFGKKSKDILYWYVYETNWGEDIRQGRGTNASIVTYSDLYEMLIGERDFL